ncbi:putative membrane protein [Rhodococcus sp. LBL1]|nr:putative membrane protein [Rhodococcus sp. LBL1]MDH6681915.1 putative membrane protein [Rhodococcus sp. LBL2]
MTDSGVEREAVAELREGPQPSTPAVTPGFDQRHPLVLWAWGLLHLDFTGIAFGTLFFCWSLTPSLLPRDWLFQGLIGGISAAIGYAVGTAIGWLVWEFGLARRSWWPLPGRIMLALKIAVPVLSILAALIMLTYSAGWQRELSTLMNAEGTTTTGYIRTLGLSALVAAAIISLWRVLRDLVRWVARQLNRLLKIPPPAASAAGLAVVLVLVFMLVDGILLRVGYAAVNSAFSLQNNETRPGAVQPLLPEKSGSPMSLAPWKTLGFEGRNFVSGGIHADELTASNGKPAKEPIRVYAGLESADDTAARMNVVVDELERTGAFERKALVIIPTTGTGWVNPTAAQAIELVENGDSALVAAQYSYLPSWISFIADRGKAAVAGNALIHAVHDRWLTKPEATRPKLYVYGESLGTQAGEGAFSGLADIRETVDGVLWVGPPNANPLWRSLTERRDPGTPEVQPVYADGLVVRFADAATDIPGAPGPWLEPRVLYIQHPSDPVVWWSPDLIFARPDWLTEPPGFDRLPSMKWFPFVTFWQVSADLANAAGVPDGHGHNYGTTILDGWVAVTQPQGWTPADTERVRAVLDSLRGHDGPEK